MVLDQVTSVEQSAVLLDMGVSDSRASFVWTTVDGKGTWDSNPFVVVYKR